MKIRLNISKILSYSFSNLCKDINENLDLIDGKVTQIFSQLIISRILINVTNYLTNLKECWSALWSLTPTIYHKPAQDLSRFKFKETKKISKNQWCHKKALNNDTRFDIRFEIALFFPRHDIRIKKFLYVISSKRFLLRPCRYYRRPFLADWWSVILIHNTV